MTRRGPRRSASRSLIRDRLRLRIVRRALVKAVRADLDAVDRIPISDAGLRQRLRTSALFASVRLRGAEDVAHFADRAVGVVGSLWLAGPAIVERFIMLAGNPALQSTNRSIQQHAAFPFYALLVGAAAVLLCQSGVNRVLGRTRTGAAPARALAVRCALPAFSMALLPLVQAPAHSDAIHWSWWAGWSIACITMLAYNLWIGVRIVHVRRAAARRCQPFDRLLLTTLSLAADIYTTSRGRLAPEDSIIACNRLEGIALLAERDLTLPSRAPYRVRRELRQDGLRVAAVFRSHQIPMATVRRPEEVDRVLSSLVAAAEALAQGDRAALLANAPESVQPPNFWRRLALRVWPAAVLVISGTLLPLIPAIASQPPIAASLRWTLVVAGVLALVASQDVAGQVGASLDKAMPWK